MGSKPFGEKSRSVKPFSLELNLFEQAFPIAGDYRLRAEYNVSLIASTRPHSFHYKHLIFVSLTIESNSDCTFGGVYVLWNYPLAGQSFRRPFRSALVVSSFVYRMTSVERD